jgi:hypothetical protein
MATMPSRSATALQALASILPQVDRLWLFLDRFDEVPPYAESEKIQVVRSQDVGDLRASGKLVSLALDDQPCTFFGVDDDVVYPADYCERLASTLERHGDAVVGVHGAILRPPIDSYGRDIKVLHRRSEQRVLAGVDLLGSDSLAFRTTALSFDVRVWPNANMVDLSFALETRRRGIPLLMVPRERHWLSALEENQADSIWAGVLREDSRQTELARELHALPRPRLPRNGVRRLSYRSA